MTPLSKPLGRHGALAGPLRLPHRLHQDVHALPHGPGHHRHGHQLERPRQGQVEVMEERADISLRARRNDPRSLRQHGQHCQEVPGGQLK